MKFQKTLVGILLGLFLIFPMAFAQEENLIGIQNETIEPIYDNNDTDLGDPGITPDSPFYGLDRAMERIELALTFNKSEKARKGLMHAKERLAEVQEMIQEKKMEHAEKAQKAHERNMNEVEEEISALSEENATEEMKRVVKLEQEINQHRMFVEKMNQNIVKRKGNLTENEEAKIQEILGAVNGSTKRLQVEVQNKAESTKIKVKLQTGKTNEEIESDVQEIVEKYNMEQKGKSGVFKTGAGKNEEMKVSGNNKDLENEEGNIQENGQISTNAAVGNINKEINENKK